MLIQSAKIGSGSRQRKSHGVNTIIDAYGHGRTPARGPRAGFDPPQSFGPVLSRVRNLRSGGAAHVQRSMGSHQGIHKGARSRMWTRVPPCTPRAFPTQVEQVHSHHRANVGTRTRAAPRISTGFEDLLQMITQALPWIFIRFGPRNTSPSPPSPWPAPCRAR